MNGGTVIAGANRKQVTARHRVGASEMSVVIPTEVLERAARVARPAAHAPSRSTPADENSTPDAESRPEASDEPGRSRATGPDNAGDDGSGRQRYLTAAQIAELLQVSAKSVYRWAAGDPTFPRLKIGGTVRFPRERMLRWLRDREQGLGRPRMPKLTRSLVEPASNGRVGRA
jgi:excisionase family DNA binding protein